MQNIRFIYLLFISTFFFQSCQSVHLLQIEMEAPDRDLNNIPVFFDIDKTLLDVEKNYCLQSGSEQIPLQSEDISPTQLRLWWIANLPAGEKKVFQLTSDCPEPEIAYSWHKAGDRSINLALNEKLLLRYEYPEFDVNERELTYKPYHHVYDPNNGILITKGPGGLYSHHRGIYYGYNKISVDGADPVDIWHNHNGEHSEHVEFIKEFSGSVFGGHQVRIEWCDTQANVFASEIRTVKVFYENGHTFIDFHSKLLPVNADVVELDGDRHHAGVQFRAANEVSENSDVTYFTRPPEVKHVRADSEIQDDDFFELPWNVMSFTLNDKQYNVAYLSHPSNPSGAEMSERSYGRFGEFFPYTLTADNPLMVHYRFIVTTGEVPSVEVIQKHYEDFSEGLNYKIK